jgi:serine/threonine protein kinase/TolA-binding protein
MENKPPSASPEQSASGSEAAIFDTILALPPEQQAGYLDQACGSNAALRRRLEKLLRSHKKADGFLEPMVETPRRGVPVGAGEDASARRPGPATTMIVPVVPSEKPGDNIGRYKIREQIGEGGCGVVYVAEQNEPVRRRVALKVIKLGMDTRSVIARFEAERQALAMMDHPNIAKVLDAGATETGRPYFVMELVRGIPITEYCDQNHLDTTRRLELFVQVCHAVQHAHQKGVIHRDIKPSNILVTLHDGVPVPKVIDFGIAKATEGRLTDLTIYTALHQFVGTPAYMSPEQAEMSELDVDTRSDIYSLGVLLYELLTGRTPFDARELLQAGVDEMRRTIRERDPLPPSTRLSTMVAADLTVVAKRHGADAPKLIHLLRGDLDWIVMKALEKDRTRRFDTANGLAADVQRFLRNDPVEARPPSGWYRFQKLVRRNKTVFAAGSLVAAALVLGLGLSLYLFVREREALRSERAARERAIAAERRQAELREQAEKGLALERQMREMAPISEKFAAAGRFMSQGQFDKADELMSQVPLTIPQGSLLFNALGDVFARLGRWPAAMTNFTRSITADPTNPVAYHFLAPLLLLTGDLAGYQRHRERILRQFGRTTDPTVAARLAKDCLLHPAPATDLGTLAGVADMAVAAGPTNRLLKGMAEYRQGHFASAATWLEEAAGQQQQAALGVQARLMLAMAQQQLKQTNQARATLASGIQLAGAKVPRLDGGNWTDPDPAHLLIREGNWADQVTAHLLMREAGELIVGASPAESPAK